MTETRVYYQWMRFDALDQWWHWIVLATVIVALISYVVYWYRRDWTELPKGLGWALLLLRLAAIAGIIFFFFDLQKRSEQKVARPSRVAVIVDTSLSMSLPMETIGNASSNISRMDATIEFLAKSPVISQLQSQHDVQVYRFDQTQRPTLVASFAKPTDLVRGDRAGINETELLWRLVARVAWAGTFLVLMGVILTATGMTARLMGSPNVQWPYVTLAGVVTLVVGLITIGTAALRGSEFPIATLWRSEFPSVDLMAAAEKIQSSGDTDNPTSPSANLASNVNDPTKFDWRSSLNATGVETRLGDAIDSVVEQERGTPLAGIVVLTDGQSNAGVDPSSAIGTAAASNIPIYAIGVGSPDDPVNVRIVDVDAPRRVFPDDRFRITALVQATGLAGKKCSVQLRRRSAGATSDNLGIEEELQIDLPASESLIPIHFDVKPREIGAWVYDVKLLPPPQDTNSQDNILETEVRVVQPKSTVLIIAGGPTREYQFVRNLLFRDKTVQSHVFLQTGGPGISQEADQLLTAFPSSLNEMAQYDCVIAFDANWMELSVGQIETLEKWISQQAGGLVLIAGPVASPKWTGSSGNGDRRAELLRNLSPVVLNGRGTRLISMGRFESETVWPLKFSQDARSMDFLQLATNPEESLAAWNNFTGVYSFYACYEPKPGALPLLYFSDPATSTDGKLPIYLATQFYGAGRVAFQGSGEIWRLRQSSDAYFDTYYTKLLRWAAQGRLLRDSDRGMLLLDKQQALVGEQIGVRAVLRDDQYQPLILPKATGRVLDPSGRSVPIDLQPVQDVNQLGVYIGQYLVKQTGSYEFQLPIGSLADRQILSQQVTVRVPTREVQRPQRNDRLLLEITQKTNGAYYPVFADALVATSATDLTPGTANNPAPKTAIASKITPREQINFLPGAPDRPFQERLMGSLMIFIGTALSLEWLIRRLSKLA